MPTTIYHPAEAPTAPLIPTLFFDKEGHGPDELQIQVWPLPVYDKEIPCLSLRIRAAGMVIKQRSQVDGGHMLYREQVIELYRQLGLWLYADTTEKKLIGDLVKSGLSQIDALETTDQVERTETVLEDLLEQAFVAGFNQQAIRSKVVINHNRFYGRDMLAMKSQDTDGNNITDQSFPVSAVQFTMEHCEVKGGVSIIQNDDGVVSVNLRDAVITSAL